MTPAAYIDAHEYDLTGLLRGLVGITTVNPPGENYDVITARLVEELAVAGLTPTRIARLEALDAGIDAGRAAGDAGSGAVRDAGGPAEHAADSGGGCGVALARDVERRVGWWIGLGGLAVSCWRRRVPRCQQ